MADIFLKNRNHYFVIIKNPCFQLGSRQERSPHADYPADEMIHPIYAKNLDDLPEDAYDLLNGTAEPAIAMRKNPLCATEGCSAPSSFWPAPQR
ncbi:hypothetical protein QMO56_20010 [Roseomonas sp. E05]|uniref:hypothetical protein n=1 Tax=Roseomonas sp. E05 TaxID=3046310 RepID=UPI0024B8BED2|nr:hypothetical protein [Roseomonas sp. E05]MDJ0390403.1 hypothetical protein [Roseomonas sp. E05]